MARLVGESGPVAGKEWKIEVGLTLGRDAHNSIAMPDNKKSSRDHAKVWKEGPSRYAVADLGSTNGTLVNDEKVTRHTLIDGDEVRVGEATFRFLLDEDEKPKKKAPAERMSELLGAKGAPGAGGAAAGFGAPGSTAGAGASGGQAMPTIEVKQRVLQYHKKDAKGTVAGWDVSQAGEGMRWLLYLIVVGVAVGLFFLVKGFMTQ